MANWLEMNSEVIPRISAGKFPLPVLVIPRGEHKVIEVSVADSKAFLNVEDARALGLYILNAVNDIEIAKESEEERYGLNEL